MKKVIQILAIALIILVPVILTAQPMPYDQAIGGGAGSAPVGGGAPIGWVINHAFISNWLWLQENL